MPDMDHLSLLFFMPAHTSAWCPANSLVRHVTDRLVISSLAHSPPLYHPRAIPFLLFPDAQVLLSAPISLPQHLLKASLIDE